MTNSDSPRADEGMNWLFALVEIALVLTALVWVVIALFLAPSPHESFAQLPSPRLTDLAIAAGMAAFALALAIAAEMLRRTMRRKARA